MQRNNDHIKRFNASDIQRYLQGEMSPSEMHELERSALDDPFLADAIEGYSRQYAKTSADAELVSLREKLAAAFPKPATENSKPAAVVQMKKNYWWRVAAIFILLAGTGALVFSLLNNNASETRSLARKERTVPASPGSSPAAASPDTVASVAPSTVTSQLARPEHDAVHQSDQTAKKASRAAKEEATVFYDSAALTRQDKAVAAGFSKQVNPAREQKVVQAFKGKVTDQDNKPIEGASVSMNNRPAAISDREGNFLVQAPDSIVKVQVTSEGYQPESVLLKSKAPSTPIKLEETLSGKAAGVAAEDRSERKKSVAYAAAEPVTGWTNFETYITQNRKITHPENTAANGVQLSFSINRKGRPVNIKIERSLSPDADAEAIRLLKNGPAWKYTSGQKDKAAIVIKF